MKNYIWLLRLLKSYAVCICLILNLSVNNFSTVPERVFLGWTNTNKQGLMCLVQGQGAVVPMRLEPATPLSRVQHSTTEPLRSPSVACKCLRQGLILAYKQF